MHSFETLVKEFSERFNTRHFPSTVPQLYEPAGYFLSIGGKRIRPVMCLMANELFGTVHNDAWHVANAIELFHNFTLIHDDIMDKAPLRRGVQTVHIKYNEPTAVLAGDVMIVVAYEYLNKIGAGYLQKILSIFNRTAREVCEGQQLDMEFEKQQLVSMNEYVHMITLKTSVLLAASLQMGGILGGSSEGNQEHLYAFGKNLGIAFQVQDDYLDAFGDPGKFGKQTGGDIMSNKKTFLLIRALETAADAQRNELLRLMKDNPHDKVERTLSIFRECRVDEWSKDLKEKYKEKALQHLDDIAVISTRKKPLRELVDFLVQRDY
ncbi:MAG: polyprenyl synthetase family protein [Chitinophagaceae bacterium]|nr:polyprenyl synthetase family protein [Chitinophagaceae bacterium]